jgi:hypothetical protein
MKAVAIMTPEPKYFANLPLALNLTLIWWTYSKTGFGICLLVLRKMGSKVPNSDVTCNELLNVCDKK